MKIKTHSVLKTFVLLCFSFVLLAGTYIAEAKTPLKVFSEDTIAGWGTILRSSVGDAGVPVLFEVQTSDDRTILLDAESNHEGIAQVEFLGFHTKRAGTYRVRAYSKFSDGPDTNFSSFLVHPDTVSLNKSQVFVSDMGLSADGNDKATMTVSLRDEHGNPIANHSIEIISSRIDDIITMSSTKTNVQGNLSATIRSEKEGNATFIVRDTLLGLTLRSRPQITFFTPHASYTAFGGNSLSANLLAQDTSSEATEANLEELFGADPGPIPPTDTAPAMSPSTPDSSLFDSDLHGELDHFKITILPSNAVKGNRVIRNEDISISVQALDNQDRVVRSYMGTSRFSSSQINALLPEDYEFKASDLGEKTFSLAVKFVANGILDLEVVDLDNWEKSGQLQIEVVDQFEDIIDAGAPAINIKYPEEGMKLGQLSLSVSGQGPSNIGLDVFVNGSLVKSADIDTDGFFSFPVMLQGGENKIFLVEQDGKQRKSNTVLIFVDNISPSIDVVEIYPEGNIKIGEFYTVKIRSETRLESVAIKDIVEHPLTESMIEPGTYEATIPVPSLSGQYPLKAILLDNLGNRTEQGLSRKLHVIEREPLNPAKVTGLRAEAMDQTVRLSWDDSTTEEGAPAVQFKIYFGENQDLLNKTVSTQDDSTVIDISPLQNGKTYYFAVTGISEAGFESNEKSLVDSATPKPLHMQLRAASGDTQVTLTWDAFSGISPSGYKIYYGLSSKSYGGFVFTPVHQTSYVLMDLANDVDYYASVVPLDDRGQDMNMQTNEIQIKPVSTGFRMKPAPSSKIPPKPVYTRTRKPKGMVGPETIWIVSLSFLMTFSVLVGRRLIRQ